MDLERDLDGMVGRMLSWLTLAPTRACGERAEALPLARGAESDGAAAEFAQRLAVEVAEQVVEATEVVEAADTTGDAETAAGEPAARAPSRDSHDSLEGKILEALAAAADGAAISQLRRRTGGKPATLRARLNRLIGRGQVQRKGQGMRTRYHLAAQGPGDG